MTYLLMGAIKVFCVAITICVIFLPKVTSGGVGSCILMIMVTKNEKKRGISKTGREMSEIYYLMISSLVS